MDFLSFDMNTVTPETGSLTLPEGWYWVKLDGSESKTERNGEHKRRTYKSTILHGPGPREDMHGKKFFDGLRESAEWYPRHMELICAACGSVEKARQMALNSPDRKSFSPDWLPGLEYLALVTVNDKFNNVVRRVPATPENWNIILSGRDPEPLSSHSGQAPVATAPQPVAGVPAPVQGSPMQMPPQAYPAAQPQMMQQPPMAPQMMAQPPMAPQMPPQMMPQQMQQAPMMPPQQYQYPAQQPQAAVGYPQQATPQQGGLMQPPQAGAVPPGPPPPPMGVPGQTH